MEKKNGADMFKATLRLPFLYIIYISIQANNIGINGREQLSFGFSDLGDTHFRIDIVFLYVHSHYHWPLLTFTCVVYICPIEIEIDSLRLRLCDSFACLANGWLVNMVQVIIKCNVLK